MKIFQLTLLSGALFGGASALSGASVTVQNLNNANNAAYGLFDSSGTRVDEAATANVRIGFFAGAFDADTAWESGDLASLNSNFTTFGSAFGMFGGFDGAFQGSPSATSTPFAGQDITIWATNGGSFVSEASEHLIYTFSSLDFQAEPWTGGQVLLGTDAGDFLSSGATASGQFGNFSFDYGFGGGALDGFNTVSVVPEPSSYALIAGVLGLASVVVRRRK